MSYLFFWTALALVCDWWAGSAAARPVRRFLVVAVALAGGLAVGWSVGMALPWPGSRLLGAAALTYLGVFELSEAWGVLLPAVEERDGRIARTFLAATGLALAGSAGLAGFLWLLAGASGGLAVGQGAAKGARTVRCLRAVSGLILSALGLATFRGVT